MRKLQLLSCLSLLSLLSIATPAQAWNSCDQWAAFEEGDYHIYNNIWGSGAGPQCLWGNDYDDWGVWADHPTAGGIKSYPNVSYTQSIDVDHLASCASSFSVSVPSGGDYSTAYDIWYDDHAYEVMLWMNQEGNIAPISYNYDASGRPAPEASNVSVGGNTWDVYRGNNGSNEVFSFVKTSEVSSGSVDIAAISRWIRDRGWFGNANLHKIEFGFEITSSEGGLDFRVDDYELNCQQGSQTGVINGTYVVQAAHSGKVMGLADASTANGGNVEQQSLTGRQSQEWTITDLGNGYYSIINVHSGKSLDVSNLSTADGANIAQYSYWGGDNQQWALQPAGDGSYLIVSRLSGKAVDVDGGSSGDGSNILQWSIHGGANQQWSLFAQ